MTKNIKSRQQDPLNIEKMFHIMPPHLATDEARKHEERNKHCHNLTSRIRNITAVELHEQGFTYADIGAIINVTPAHVKRYVQQGRKQMNPTTSTETHTTVNQWKTFFPTTLFPAITPINFNGDLAEFINDPEDYLNSLEGVFKLQEATRLSIIYREHWQKLTQLKNATKKTGTGVS